MSKWREIRDIIEEILAGGFFLAGCALVVYGVIVRYLFHKPLFWVDEVSTYLLVWGILLGWSMAEKKGKHLSVGILYDFLPKRFQYVISIFEKICSLLFSAFLTAASYFLWLHYYNNGQISTNSQVELWLVYLIMPIGSILLGIRFLEELVNIIKTGEVPRGGDHH
ncbi:MAG: TRAP transporter small permease [Dehalobacterium sp.]|jgi:C4-dicarboxylate transporter DctQ subunit